MKPRTSYRSQLVTAFAIPVLLCAQETKPALPDRVLSTTIRLRDWDINQLEEIKLGQLSVALQGPKATLTVHKLMTTVPAARRAGIPNSVREKLPKLNLLARVEGEANILGGRSDIFQRAPSAAQLEWIDDRQNGSAVRCSFSRSGEGFCGFWVQLYDPTILLGQREYFDASQFKYLSFLVRSKTPGLSVLLKMADALWDRKEDALAVEFLQDCVPGKQITENWKRGILDLDILTRLSRKELAVVSFKVSSPGDGAFEIAGLEFLKELSDTSAALVRDVVPALSSPLRRATWVWNTESLLASPEEQNRLLQFLKRIHVTDVFLQLPLRKVKSSEIPFETRALRKLVSRLHAGSVATHALDGFAGYALPEYHAVALGIVDGVVTYNRQVKPEERFDGVHLDIEPHLLPGFGGTPRLRHLMSFLVLLKQVVERTRAAHLSIGVDIPSWFDEPDELTHEVEFIEFGGKRAHVSEHVIDLVDEVGMMSYRTESLGAGGVLRQVMGELEYAADRGKKIFIGIETEPLPDEVLVVFSGAPSAKSSIRAGDSSLVSLAWKGDSVLVSLVPPGKVDEFLVSPGRGALYWVPSKRVSVPSARISFAAAAPSDIDRFIHAAEPKAVQFNSFAGFAIHHYESWRRLLDKAQDGR